MEKWAYIVYWTSLSTVMMECPDAKQGYSCPDIHTKEVGTDFRAGFWYRKNAVSFTDTLRGRGYVAIEIDSMPRNWLNKLINRPNDQQPWKTKLWY